MSLSSPWQSAVSGAMLGVLLVFLGPACRIARTPEEQAERHLEAAARLIEQKQYRKAEQELLTAVKLAPQHLEARMALGQFYAAVRRHQQALAQFEVAVKQHPDNTNAREALTESYLALGRFSEAADQAEKLIAQEPDDPLGYNYLAAAHLARGDPTAAINVLTKALRAKPDSPLTYKNLGDAYVLKHDLRAAIRHYEKAVELGPKFAEAHDRLGVAYVLSRNYQTAEKEYAKAIEADPDYVEAYCNLALLHADHTGKLDEALAVAEQAVCVDPMSADAHDTLGWVQYRRGRFKEAVTAFREARKLAPKDPNILAHLGMALCKTGDVKEGKALLKSALRSAKSLQHPEEARAALGTASWEKGR